MRTTAMSTCGASRCKRSTSNGRNGSSLTSRIAIVKERGLVPGSNRPVRCRSCSRPPSEAADVRRDRARERRRHHVVAAPLEQRIVQQLAQPGERMAHRRLRQVQTLAGRRDAAVAVDRVEDREQVQVDPGKLHWRAPCRTLGAQYAQCMQGVDAASCSRCIGVRRAAQHATSCRPGLRRAVRHFAARQETSWTSNTARACARSRRSSLEFFDEHIYPNEARYAAEIAENRRGRQCVQAAAADRGAEAARARRAAVEPVPAALAARAGRPVQPGVRAAVRDHGTRAVGARSVQLRRAGHRQHGNDRALRHARRRRTAGWSRCSPGRSARRS